MARQRKKLSEAEKAYNAQVRRIKQFTRRAEKRGYAFNAEVLPPRPKKITQASVRRLQKITPEKLYKKAEYVNRETGEVVSGTKARKAERQKSYYKTALTRLEKHRQKVQQEIDRISDYKSTYNTHAPKFEKDLKKLQKQLQKLQQHVIQRPKNLDILNEYPVASLPRSTKQPEVQKSDNITSVQSPEQLFNEVHEDVLESIDEPETEEPTEEPTEEYDNDEDYDYQQQLAEERATERWREQQREQRRYEEYMQEDNRAVTNEDNLQFSYIMQMIDAADPQHTGAGEELREMLQNEIENVGYHHTMDKIANAPREVREAATVSEKYNYSGEARARIFDNLAKLIQGRPLGAETVRHFQDYGEQYNTENSDVYSQDNPSMVSSTPSYDYAQQERVASLEKKLSDTGREMMNKMMDTTWYESLSPQDKARFQIEKDSDYVTLTTAKKYNREYNKFAQETGIDDSPLGSGFGGYIDDMQEYRNEANDILDDSE